ncbi:MAG TPA: RNA 2',3'-cyclic phosphodiesterase [Terriglobales bacterium]|nr:RNA 2',3'-cyclic phosphodiesterase [Terriglobales bacterium]
MRTFVAFDIQPDIRERITEFVEHVRENAPDVRWVSEESLHVTLKFIGEKSEADVKRIEAALGSVRGHEFRLGFRGAGFFPTPKAARVFWIGIEAEKALADLAKNIEETLSAIDVPKEERGFNPHLTLARARGGSGSPGWRRGDKPSRQFANLQGYLENHPAPEFGAMTAREFFLYESQLSSKGARYTKIARFGLQPPTA